MGFLAKQTRHAHLSAYRVRGILITGRESGTVHVQDVL
jgi:hypothetical protein